MTQIHVTETKREILSLDVKPLIYNILITTCVVDGKFEGEEKIL
jgi:hypothetical protein